jgi:hypothetical protein
LLLALRFDVCQQPDINLISSSTTSEKAPTAAHQRYKFTLRNNYSKSAITLPAVPSKTSLRKHAMMYIYAVFV